MAKKMFDRMTDGRTVETWYSGRKWGWCTQVKDSAGNQIGTCEYNPDQPRAAQEHGDTVARLVASGGARQLDLPHCERCGEALNPATLVELELDNATGLYVRPGTIPAGNPSQGIFYFGAACARAVLAAGGHVRTIGARAPANRRKR